MKKTILGFIYRTAYASLLSIVAWTACTWPYGASVWQRRVVKGICYATDFPTAIIGRLTAPYRGMDVIFDTGGEWCDFCPREHEFWYHVRFAVPVYLALFYIPVILKCVARRSKRLFKRITIGTSIYAVMVTVYFLGTGGSDRSGDIRLAAKWLVVLAAATAFGWSSLKLGWRATGVVGVLLLGAWWILLGTTYTVSTLTTAYLSDYTAYLLVLVIGITFLLAATRVVERGLEHLHQRIMNRRMMGS